MPNEINPASPLFPRQSEPTQGWILDTAIMQRLHSIGEDGSNWWPSMEEVEAVLIAAENSEPVARLQARVAELEAAVRKAAELAWDASGEGFNGEYTPKVVTPKDIDAMLDEVALQALNPEAK
jgi:hypothetical protein